MISISKRRWSAWFRRRPCRHVGRGDHARGDPGGGRRHRRRQGRDPHGHAPQSHGTRHRDDQRDRLRHRRLLRARPLRHRDRRHLRGEATTASSPMAANVNVTGSKVHDIGENPLQRHAARQCHLLLQRRERHDQRQPGLQLPEERDHRQRQGRRLRRSLHRQDLSDGHEQHRDRRRPHQLHRPERHPDQLRRERHRGEEHRQRLQLHTDGTVATGLLLYEAGRVNVQNNNISGNEVDIYDAGYDRQATSSPSSRALSNRTGVSAWRPRSFLASERPTQLGETESPLGGLSRAWMSWRAREDSNLRPLGPQPNALSAELRAPETIWRRGRDSNPRKRKSPSTV